MQAADVKAVGKRKEESGFEIRESDTAMHRGWRVEMEVRHAA